MPTTIITIGYRSFALRRPGDAAAVLKALSDAVPLESHYEGPHEIYWPDVDHHREISMRVVPDKHILPNDPKEDLKPVKEYRPKTQLQLPQAID